MPVVNDINKINPNIRKWVTKLNEANFFTVDSGDGETHDYECDRDIGYVVVVARPDELISRADELKKLIESWGVTVAMLDPEGVAENSVYIQANYSPMDKVALIDISGCHDSQLCP